MIVRFPCSPEQADVIADHLIEGKVLGMQPDERAWLISHVEKKYPGQRIVHADLSLSDSEWVVELMTHEAYRARKE